MNCTLPDAKGTVRTPQTSRPPLPNPVAKRASRSRFGKDLKFFPWDKTFSVTDEHPKLTACKYREQAVYEVVVTRDSPRYHSTSDMLIEEFEDVIFPVGHSLVQHVVTIFGCLAHGWVNLQHAGLVETCGLIGQCSAGYG